MELFQIAFFTLIAYLIGALPTTRLLAKLFFGLDITEHGSGMATHSNVAHVMGQTAGNVSRVISASKGLLAAKLAVFLYLQGGIFSEDVYPILMLTFGLAALLGHIFPVFSSFQGGQGIYVTFGLLLAVQPLLSLICVGVTLLILLISRYENLGYIAGMVAFPVVAVISGKFAGTMFWPTMAFAFLLLIILFLSLRMNLLSIIHGTEAKSAYPRLRFRRRRHW
jgi:glycerol-3-phosphate acyltransferase PlsY